MELDILSIKRIILLNVPYAYQHHTKHVSLTTSTALKKTSYHNTYWLKIMNKNMNAYAFITNEVKFPSHQYIILFYSAFILA